MAVSECPVAVTEDGHNAAVFADGVDVHAVAADHEVLVDHGIVDTQGLALVVGFVVASLVFSFLLDVESAKAVGKITKGFTNTLFSIAFVCVGLETRFADIFSKENRRPLWAFLTAQGVKIIVTLVVAYLLFGVVKPLFA